jgi:hypothetical protein
LESELCAGQDQQQIVGRLDMVVSRPATTNCKTRLTVKVTAKKEQKLQPEWTGESDRQVTHERPSTRAHATLLVPPTTSFQTRSTIEFVQSIIKFPINNSIFVVYKIPRNKRVSTAVQLSPRTVQCQGHLIHSTVSTWSDLRVHFGRAYRVHIRSRCESTRPVHVRCTCGSASTLSHKTT